MRKVWVAAVLAAGSLALAGHACAAIVQADWQGDFNDSPLYSSWGMTIVYDTSFATEINPAPDSGHQLTWNIGSGTPSPVLSLSGLIEGRTSPGPCCYSGPFPVPDISFSIADFTSFTLEQGGFLGYHLIVTGGSQSVSLGSEPGPFTNPTTLVPFDVNFVTTPSDYGSWTLDGVTQTAPFTHLVRVTVLSVPEPTTWALMLTGFFGLGAALRRRRAAFA